MFWCDGWGLVPSPWKAGTTEVAEFTEERHQRSIGGSFRGAIEVGPEKKIGEVGNGASDPRIVLRKRICDLNTLTP